MILISIQLRLHFVDETSSTMEVSLEDIIFLTSLAFLVVVIVCGVVAMSLARSTRMSDTGIEDIESTMANYEGS